MSASSPSALVLKSEIAAPVEGDTLNVAAGTFTVAKVTPAEASLVHKLALRKP